VRIDIPEQRWPASVEAAAYFVVAEALTNVAKHAQASVASVRVTLERGDLCVVIEDDGAGGAVAPAGGGLAGLRDRINAFHGRLSIDSPPGTGTRITAEIPVPPPAPSEELSSPSDVCAASAAPH
jgi:signal transduction histidine kinase